MKIDNKGVTIVEIIISLVIISIVLSLLFSLLVQVRNEDIENDITSSYKINKATIIKEIEDDIMSLGVLSLSECDVHEFLRDGSRVENPLCLRIQYADTSIRDNVGALMIYKYDAENNTKKWLIRYVRGFYMDCNAGEEVDYSRMRFRQSFTVSKDYPEETFNAQDVENYRILEIKYSALPNDGILNHYNVGNIIINIESPNNNQRYNISIPFTFEGNDTFKIIEKNNNAKIFGRLYCPNSEVQCDAVKSISGYKCTQSN